MKLYDYKAAPNPRRVRIYMAEKGIDIPLIPVDIMKREQKSPDFLAKNPLGSLPVLELADGTCISESVAICRYLEALYPEPPLFGRTAAE
jgi:glutathione S-transferase